MASDQGVSRPVAEFSPTIWENPLVSFSVGNESAFEPYERKRSVLREKVKGMLIASTGNAVENVKFINTLYRLGVSYHFENEIEGQLKEIYNVYFNDLTNNLDNYDLHTVSLVFHTLRSHGYMIPSDVFKKFKKEDGKFEETLAMDARAMLSLYEAAQWSTRGEEILDEALAFAKPRLESLSAYLPRHLSKYINYLLDRPYHKDIPRISARHFISFYEEEGTRNHNLLEFAKLDFNLLQLMYRRELSNLCRWYKDLNLHSKLPYARDRTVEAYFWGMGTYFEPQYSHARVIFAKTLILISFLNDTYDAYGTIEELNSLTDTIQRWEVNDELPDYMKILCRALFNFYSEVEKDRPQGFVYAKNALKQLAKAYHQEAKWLNLGQIPTLEGYINNGIDSCGYHAVLSLSTKGMGQAVDLEAFQWLSPRPKIVETLETIGRLINDISSHKFEQQRQHCASSVECCMKQHGVSEEEATKEVQELVKQKWKEWNEDFMRPNPVSRPLIQSLLNLMRTNDLIYKDGDAYTQPELLKDSVVMLLIDDIPM